MKFYIASRLKNYEKVKDLADKLKTAGWTHTYDWTIDSSLKADSIEKLKEIGQMEYNGVKDADVVIVLTPQGGGTHTELGMAIAFGKQVYVCHSDNSYFSCGDNTSPFYWLPQVSQFVGDIDDIANMLINNHEC